MVIRGTAVCGASALSSFSPLVKKTETRPEAGKIFFILLTLIKFFYFHQKVAKTAAVDRLTDTSRYTGSHKERFDDSGKGKGREGREEIVENTGYVGAYKNAGTYDTKVKAEK